MKGTEKNLNVGETGVGKETISLNISGKISGRPIQSITSTQINFPLSVFAEPENCFCFKK